MGRVGGAALLPSFNQFDWQLAPFFGVIDAPCAFWGLAVIHRALLVGTLLVMMEAPVEEAPSVKYRISYRRTEDAPWVFYADVHDEAKSQRLEKRLNQIGFQAQVLVVSSSKPAPPRAPSATPAPAKSQARLPPQPSVRANQKSSSRDFFPSARNLPQQEMAPLNGFFSAFDNAGLGGGLGWGWGARQPRLNPAPRTGAGSGRSGHPTAHPYFGR